MQSKLCQAEFDTYEFSRIISARKISRVIWRERLTLLKLGDDDCYQLINRQPSENKNS